MSDLQERVLTAKAVLIHGVYEGIQYVVPCFPVLTVDLHRCRASVIGEDNEPGPSFDCLVNSAEIQLASCPQVIISYSSFHINVGPKNVTDRFRIGIYNRNLYYRPNLTKSLCKPVLLP